MAALVVIKTPLKLKPFVICCIKGSLFDIVVCFDSKVTEIIGLTNHGFLMLTRTNPEVHCCKTQKKIVSYDGA